MPPDYRTRTQPAEERAFIERALTRVGVAEEDARTVAEVLLAADLRGIESHGIARLDYFYVRRIERGRIAARPTYRVLHESATSYALDAGNGLGHPAGALAMAAVIAKARETGIAFGTVVNSNHYGIAGWYAMRALPYDVIGISSTNSLHLAVPTFGRELLSGTNPFAFAIPAAEEPPFVLDFATTTVTRGKLEVYDRNERPLHDGWAVDRDGTPTNDAKLALHGGLLPLGGFGTENGGHKGYGLALLCEILTGVLGGGLFSHALDGPEGIDARAGITSHWFGAIALERVGDPATFKRDLDRELRTFKGSATAPGAERVYVAGEIEHENTLAHERDGVPIHPKTWAELDAMAERIGIPPLARFEFA